MEHSCGESEGIGKTTKIATEVGGGLVMGLFLIRKLDNMYVHMYVQHLRYYNDQF